MACHGRTRDLSASGRMFGCVPGSLTAQDSRTACECAVQDVAFRSVSMRRHPEVWVFRGSSSWPIVPPVYASPPPSRATPQDSEPVWFATPSPYDSFIRYILPASMLSGFASFPPVQAWLYKTRCLRHRLLTHDTSPLKGTRAYTPSCFTATWQKPTYLNVAKPHDASFGTGVVQRLRLNFFAEKKIVSPCTSRYYFVRCVSLRTALYLPVRCVNLSSRLSQSSDNFTEESLTIRQRLTLQNAPKLSHLCSSVIRSAHFSRGAKRRDSSRRLIAQE
jgi:hypothetical protein